MKFGFNLSIIKSLIIGGKSISDIVKDRTESIEAKEKEKKESIEKKENELKDLCKKDKKDLTPRDIKRMKELQKEVDVEDFLTNKELKAFADATGYTPKRDVSNIDDDYDLTPEEKQDELHELLKKKPDELTQKQKARLKKSFREDALIDLRIGRAQLFLSVSPSSGCFEKPVIYAKQNGGNPRLPASISKVKMQPPLHMFSGLVILCRRRVFNLNNHTIGFFHVFRQLPEESRTKPRSAMLLVNSIIVKKVLSPLPQEKSVSQNLFPFKKPITVIGLHLPGNPHHFQRLKLHRRKILYKTRMVKLFNH